MCNTDIDCIFSCNSNLRFNIQPDTAAVWLSVWTEWSRVITRLKLNRAAAMQVTYHVLQPIKQTTPVTPPGFRLTPKWLI